MILRFKRVLNCGTEIPPEKGVYHNLYHILERRNRKAFRLKNSQPFINEISVSQLTEGAGTRAGEEIGATPERRRAALAALPAAPAAPLSQKSRCAAIFGSPVYFQGTPLSKSRRIHLHPYARKGKKEKV